MLAFISLRRLAEAYSRQARKTIEQSDNRSASAWVLEITGVYALGVGQWKKAQALLSQAMVISDHLQDLRRREECLDALNEVSFLQGNFVASAKLWAGIYQSARDRGDTQAESWGVAGCLRNLLMLDQVPTAQSVEMVRALEALLTGNIGIADAINGYGVLALIHLRFDLVSLARKQIDIAAQLIDQSSPTGFGVIHGYSSTAEVYLTLWETHLFDNPRLERQQLQQSARQACRALFKYARAFPIGKPRAWLWQGLYYWLAGKTSKAYRTWEKCLTVASELDMPYEQGLAHFEIGRHLSPRHTKRQEHLQAAHNIFERLNANYDLKRVQRLRE